MRKSTSAAGDGTAATVGGRAGVLFQASGRKSAGKLVPGSTIQRRGIGAYVSGVSRPTH
ncbi:hypothetical protein [Streptomyces avermitilis]|uniref:hypothetical protein n=1 Tax=Streptomyces avermitilis TaxID=33903 RepID=UPI0036BBAA58